MDEAIKKILIEMTKTQYGAALLKFLEKEYEKIGEVENIKNEVELEGAKKARELIKKIFDFYGDKLPLNKNRIPYV